MTISVAYPYGWCTLNMGNTPLIWCQKIKMQQSTMNPTTNHVNIFIYKKQFYKNNLQTNVSEVAHLSVPI